MALLLDLLHRLHRDETLCGACPNVIPEGRTGFCSAECENEALGWNAIR